MQALHDNKPTGQAPKDLSLPNEADLTTMGIKITPTIAKQVKDFNLGIVTLEQVKAWSSCAMQPKDHEVLNEQEIDWLGDNGFTITLNVPFEMAIIDHYILDREALNAATNGKSIYDKQFLTPLGILVVERWQRVVKMGIVLTPKIAYQVFKKIAKDNPN